MQMKRPPTLRLTQGLAVAVHRRDTVAVKQALYVLTTLIQHDYEGEQILRELNTNLSPSERHWFGTLDGARIPVASA